MKLHLESKMSGLVSNLTAAALLAHILLGCCSHHAHADAINRCSEPSAVASGCPCGSHQSEDRSRSHDEPSERQECEVDTCVFTRAESVGTSELLAARDCLALINVSPSVPRLSVIDTADSGRYGLGIPIRLHLLNRVLLL